MKNIRVLIIDEHPAVCRALTSRLGSVPSITVVGAMSDFNEGLRGVRELRPNVILLELKVRKKAKVVSQNLDPVVALSMLQECGPARVIVLTAYLDEAERDSALKAGARRYLLKQIDTAQLVSEIESVAAGNGVAATPLSGGPIPLLLGDGSANLREAAETNIQERNK